MPSIEELLKFDTTGIQKNVGKQNHSHKKGFMDTRVINAYAEIQEIDDKKSQLNAVQVAQNEVLLRSQVVEQGNYKSVAHSSLDKHINTRYESETLTSKSLKKDFRVGLTKAFVR